MGAPHTRLTIGELAERSGAATSALRFYEDRGLIHSERTTGNQRRYKRDQLRRVAFIRSAQQVGLSLGEITEALDSLPGDRAPTPEDWGRLSASWRTRLDAQIQRLVELRDTLSDCIGCGCLSMKKCALYNPDDRKAALGPGAHWGEPLPPSE